ncbi:MAG TPA: alpha/beta hydrolase [Flavipsychrobacter sp.]
MPRKRFIRVLLYSLLIVFIAANVLAYNHAHKFTNFSKVPETGFDTDNLSLGEKIKYACMGVDNPRPCTKTYPAGQFETVYIKSNTDLECWMLRAENPKGTVLMFHGYKADKSDLLDRAYIINNAGYNTLLVDFMGSGGSAGSEVTIGYHEAQNVSDCYNYIAKQGEENIMLFGISMGAAAIMRSIAVDSISPKAVVIEAPFGSMLRAVTNRFGNVGFPPFPMAQLLVFWGGVQHGFWAFGHNPAEYAKQINCPVMIIYGAKDDRVTMDEITDIQDNIRSDCKLAVYPNAGHVNFLTGYRQQWANDVLSFAGKWVK